MHARNSSEFASSGFYSITWRMLSRSAGYKIHFRKQPPFRGNFVPCRCDMVRFLNLYSLAIRPRLLCFSSYNQINKQPENLYVNCRECFGYFTQLAESSFFLNNVILHLKSSPFIHRWGNLLCQCAWENHGNSWLTSTKTQVSTERKNSSVEGVC